MAAVISLLTISVGVTVLPSQEYASFALATSYAAVVVTIFFLPFSKFVLLEGETPGIARNFLLTQVALLLGAGAGFATLPFLSDSALKTKILLILLAVVFAVSQGLKDFSGEMARSRGDARSAQQIYVLDSLLTLVLACMSLLLWRRYEALILSSAISSLLVGSSFLRRARPDSFSRGEQSRIRRVFGRSGGLVVSGGVASFAIATGRTALLAASPAPVAGFVQYLVDVLQRVIALWASTLLSSALPYVRRNGAVALASSVRWAMLVSLPVMATVVIGINLFSDAVVPNGVSRDGLGAVSSVCLLLMVWTTRYRTTVLEMPALASDKAKWIPLVGSVTTLLATILAFSVGPDLGWVALSLASAQVIGGAATVYLTSRMLPQDAGGQAKSLSLVLALLAAGVVLQIYGGSE